MCPTNDRFAGHLLTGYDNRLSDGGKKVKKGIIRAVVLSVVFLAAIVFFGYYTNQNGVNLTTEMPLPSFPMLKLEVRGSEVAEL